MIWQAAKSAEREKWQRRGKAAAQRTTGPDTLPPALIVLVAAGASSEASDRRSLPVPPGKQEHPASPIRAASARMSRGIFMDSEGLHLERRVVQESGPFRQ
jgi:hypothetical protein